MTCKLQPIKKHYALPLQAALGIHVCGADTHGKIVKGSRAVIGKPFSTKHILIIVAVFSCGRSSSLWSESWAPFMFQIVWVPATAYPEWQRLISLHCDQEDNIWLLMYIVACCLWAERYQIQNNFNRRPWQLNSLLARFCVLFRGQWCENVFESHKKPMGPRSSSFSMSNTRHAQLGLDEVLVLVHWY